MCGHEREPGEEVDRLARAVLDAAFEVHRHLGPGWPESVYEQALCVELELRGLGYVRQPAVAVIYKGQRVGEGRLDLLVEGKLIVEVKATETLTPVHVAQVLTYLKATGCGLGLLITFNVALLRRAVRRLVLSAPAVTGSCR